MAVVRIRGEWILTFHEQGLLLTGGGSPTSYSARLVVSSADRSRLNGRFYFEADEVDVAGRVKPGNPGIVTLTETSGGNPIQDGLEAILYVPPFWPMIDYRYDLIVGVLTISSRSQLQNKAIQGRPFSVFGVKELPAPPGPAKV